MEGNEKTKVFISWSGELSHEVAKILRKKLPAIIQSVEVFFSSTDIQKGENGVQAISKSLQDSQISIVILTKENKDKPWILFEAGCIHGHGGIFCSLLIDVSTEEITGPLLQFQHTLFNEEDFFNLLCTVNEKTAHPLERDVLRESLEGHWPGIKNKVNQKIKDYPCDITENEKVDARDETIDDFKETIKRYSDSECEMALHAIILTYCCGYLKEVYNLQDIRSMTKWDVSYIKHIADKSFIFGLVDYNSLFKSYSISDRGKDFMLQLGLFSAKGYSPPSEAQEIIKAIGEEYLLEVCVGLFGKR